MGICGMPFTVPGICVPTSSSSVGATSLTWWNCVRTPPASDVSSPAGQWMTNGSRTPPPWVFCL
jgi:hypothetical protein